MNKFNKLDENGARHIPENYQEVIKDNLWIIESDSKQGTAFLLKNVGFITCYHCVYGNNDKLMNNLKVFQNATNTYEIEVLKSNKHIDIVVFRLKNKNIDFSSKGFSMGNSQNIVVGSMLKLAGFPERGGEYEPDIRDMKVTRTKSISLVEHICVDCRNSSINCNSFLNIIIIKFWLFNCRYNFIVIRRCTLVSFNYFCFLLFFFVFHNFALF